MEHRWHERKPVGLEMFAKCGKLRSFRGRARNMSRGGILFDTGVVSLVPNAVVKLFCSLFTGKHRRSYFVRAQVVYVDKGCSGMIFLEHEAAYTKFEVVLDIMVSLFNAKTGARLQTAIVKAKVSGKGFNGSERELEQMIMGGVQGYGNFFNVPRKGAYRVELEIQPLGKGKVIKAVFQYASA